MKIERVLITSDDGFDSMGVKLLVRALQGKYELKIAGTHDQQSAMGGKMTFPGSGWGQSQVEGVEAVWVDGTPVDAVDVAQAFFERPFDLVVSGINWGVNIGASLITSGTVAAAYRSMGVGLTQQAISISWEVAADGWMSKNSGDKKILENWLAHPGETAKWILDLAIANQLWGARWLNVNLPPKTTREWVWTKPLPDQRRYYKYPLELDRESGRFLYPIEYSDELERDIIYDSGAVLAGLVSVSPLRPDMLDERLWEEVKRIA